VDNSSAAFLIQLIAFVSFMRREEQIAVRVIGWVIKQASQLLIGVLQTRVSDFESQIDLVFDFHIPLLSHSRAFSIKILNYFNDQREGLLNFIIWILSIEH